MKRKFSAQYLAEAAVIASLYVMLTFIASWLGLSSGVVQLRFSEALAILPYFISSAVPGLFVGCLLANILTGAALWDIIFGSLATLLGAVLTRLLHKKSKWLAPLPPIAANTVIIPFVLIYAYGVPDGLPFLMLTVGAGEVLSCGVLGMTLLFVLDKNKNHIFDIRCL